MSARTATRLAWSLCAAALALLGLQLLLILLGSLAGSSTKLPEGWLSWQAQAIDVLGFIGAPVLGGLVASRRPDNPYGWLWLGYGMGFACTALGDSYAAYSEVAGLEPLPATRTILAVLEMGWPVAISLLPFLLLLFPDGMLPSPRWRLVAWPVAVMESVLLIFVFFRPGRQNPFGVEGPVGEVVIAITDVGLYIVFAAIVLSALSLVFRYYRAAGVQRQQLKWFAFAAAVLGALIVGVLLGLHKALGETLWTLLSAATFTGLYVAVGVAILRYRLYDIDLIINRTLVYGTLTAMLALVYFGGVAATQAIFRALTGQEEQPQLAVVVSTLVIAALFNPLRRRIQGFIDRHFYRRKYDARKTLEAFSAKLRDETDLDALSDDLVGVVRETMQPAHVSLWLRPDRFSEGK
jgi:hypothetical protein